MTTFERFERDIPELMTELAPAQVPDYFDDMLQQTATHRQRPAWSYLERWLPMGVIAQTLPVRPFSWRPLLVLTLVGLLIAAALIAYAGSVPQRLPAPFGPARNGQIVFSTADGDIASVDPASGVITTLIGGPTQDIAPWLAPDGRHFLFVRTGERGEAYFIADANGANVRELVAPRAEWFEWSPSADRIVVSHFVDGSPVVSVVDVASGVSTALDVGIDIQSPMWRSNHDQIAFVSDASGDHRFYLVNPDGSGLRALSTAPGAVNAPSFSPDGRSFAYATWVDGQAGGKGRIHIFDIDQGTDRALMFDGSAGSEELNPIFSPDASKLLIERYVWDGTYRLIVVPADGGGPATALGDSHPEGTNGASSMWSPDGTTILTTYENDHRTWLLAADGNRTERVTWTTTGSVSWQRLAP
jgi:Tol biopolymer transport system component